MGQLKHLPALIYAGVLIILYWFLAWVLDRRRIYIRV